jgi:hypothetical protein
MKKLFAAAARETARETFERKMQDIVGKRVTTGSRPYPYIYKHSKGIVTHIEFCPGMFQCTFYTDQGEVITSQDSDLTYASVR